MALRPKVGLVAFGDGSRAWRASGLFMRQQAISQGLFNQVAVLTYRDIRALEPRLFQSYLSSRQKPGFNYWKWKPVIISEFQKIWAKELDVLVYLDVGCWLDAGPMARKFFYDYAEQTLSQGATAFSLGSENLEHRYTRKDVLQSLGASVEIMNSPQIQAGVILIRCREKSILIEDWAELAKFEEWMFEDAEPPSFEEKNISHRHDQSVFSVLFKSAGLMGRDTAEIETRPRIFDGHPISDYPFWAGRLRNKVFPATLQSVVVDKVSGKLP